MKKLLIITGFIIIIIVAGLHFGTYQKVTASTLPISNIGNGTINNMVINYHGRTVKAPFNPDFVLIKDEKFGDPNGTFTLVTKQNVFGFIKYEAVYNKKEG